MKDIIGGLCVQVFIPLLLLFIIAHYNATDESVIATVSILYYSILILLNYLIKKGYFKKK
jgi:hypothetical protein